MLSPRALKKTSKPAAIAARSLIVDRRIQYTQVHSLAKWESFTRSTPPQHASAED
ncbi:hypothetical protein SAY86_028748 [Trapa natans]|uniref:Uncharacterized protein n=1 Tax=Trapa natans TaxID=22666 RepID=A0AAN7M1X0_TRANT|nr:hypothetical protein SAY86_028748 [Trapa natans]